MLLELQVAVSGYPNNLSEISNSELILVSCVVIMNEIVKCTDNRHKLCLSCEGIFWGLNKKGELILDNPKNSFDSISGLSMTKIEQFFIIDKVCTYNVINTNQLINIDLSTYLITTPRQLHTFR
jgi:hypothetical protein